jgi:hypothetical protein
MPQLYQKLGIHFQYPDNWTLDEQEALEGNGAVSVFSPEGGFWSVAVHPPTADLPKLLSAAVTAMREVYEQLDAEAVDETIAGQELIGYDMNFYCLDLTNSACVRGIRAGQRILVIFCQAEDREFERIAPIFHAMSTSLLQPAG